jgi:hypothetical protein
MVCVTTCDIQQWRRWHAKAEFTVKSVSTLQNILQHLKKYTTIFTNIYMYMYQHFKTYHHQFKKNMTTFFCSKYNKHALKLKNMIVMVSCFKKIVVMIFLDVEWIEFYSTRPEKYLYFTWPNKCTCPPLRPRNEVAACGASVSLASGAEVRLWRQSPNMNPNN